ncbi:MAG: PorV/PorQ family protein [Calditrichaeota bacterium]|nr:PorV/PorQ family protein [Calditrichota bacterium]
MRWIHIWGMIVGIGIGLLVAGEAGQTGLPFLKIGVGAPAAGMGNAYTAVASDAFATYWNPAGLMAARSGNVVFTHTNWLFDAISEFAAWQVRGQQSSVALHLYTFYVGQIPVRLIPSDQPLATTNAQYLSGGISYARNLRPHLALGVTLKYLYEKIYVETATGWALDVGVRYQMPGHPLVLAATLQHLGKMNALLSRASRLPTVLRAGIAYQPDVAVGPAKFQLAVDGLRYWSGSWKLNSGLEVKLWRQLALRAGYLLGYDDRSLGFGFGFQKATLRFDYSFNPFGAGLGEVHRFSMFLAL